MVDLSKIAGKLKSTVASDVPDPKDFVSTGNLAFDLVADGGVPFGYVVEFLGFSSSGKSLFIQQIIANAQKMYGAIGLLADRENAYTNKRGEQLGIDNSQLLLLKPKEIPTITHCFNLIIENIKAIREQDEDAYICVGIDSISAFGKDVALEKSDSGRKAKAAHEGLRELLNYIDDKVMLLVANQKTYKIGVMYGDNTSSTAGESMKYYSALRFSLQDRHQIADPKRGNEVIGNWIGIEVIKTRLGPCYRECYIPHYYKTGIDYYGGYARLLVDRNFLKPKNKTEFQGFRQSTIVYEEGGEKEQYNEFRIEKLLEAHPELLFKEYPEYNLKGDKNGQEGVEEEE
jgi:RecA/RadA recombinase